jgi:hypothetical protein
MILETENKAGENIKRRDQNPLAIVFRAKELEAIKNGDSSLRKPNTKIKLLDQNS